MSDSSPELLGHRTREERASLSRSASYQNLPEAADFGPVSPPLRRTFSDLATPNQAPSPTKEDVAAGKDILRRTSLRSQSKDPAIAVTRVTGVDEKVEKLDEENSGSPSSESESQDAAPIRIPETKPPEPVAQPSKARVMSGRLVSLARKPWSSSSPSRPATPSPNPPKTRVLPTGDAQPLEEPPAQPDFKAAAQSEVPVDSDTTQPARKRTMLNKRPRRPVVAVVTHHGHSDSVDSQKSPASLLRPKNSLDKFTASLNISTPVLPPNSKPTTTSPMTFSSSVDPPRKKDDLWGVFRGLEADNQKFQSKSSALKANVIRSSLIPFLNRHQFHSCKNLRPEDLDRRVNILNKWWTGLLEMLNGKHNQSISGTDRPVYLEAVVGIMTRPEWRIAFPMSHPSESLPRSLQHTPTSLSDSSDRSSGSDFLLESIHHNIRNIFTQNLLAQMAFVVERMSMRHAPASLVAFCGKACAYAFFFCPGVADALVRLWGTPASSYQRVFAESGVLNRSSTASRAFAQDLAMSFPVALQSLSFHSHIPLVRYLRQKPDIPVNASQIPWHSPWVSRWCGRDTDLFFVFVKFVHILYADSMPRDMDKKKRILAPGLLPIHAQLLVVLEKTLHKQPGPQGGAADNSHSTAATTFDDFIEGADAAVSALPLGAANSHRSMAENRLIILLRDFLSESSVEPNRARLLYAESFCAIIKAAMQRTSLYDHNTCFLICDFMEEVIPIITKYSQSVEMVLFDWSFWLVVCKKMMESHNSVTEVRVFSFIYCMWNTWVASEQRKEDLCLNFLLHESWFYQYYNHWSSMVRSYFHRLLCWRVARLNDELTPLDTIIYEVLSSRLRRIWEYFVASQIKAAEEGTAPLSSAPCTPAPGRRIIIIRCDSQVATNNLFVSFDRVVPPAPPEDASLSRKSSSGSTSTTDSSLSETQNQPKRKWGILKAMFGVSSSSKSSDSQSSSSSPDEKEKESSKPDATSNTDKCVENHPQPPFQTEIPRPKTAAAPPPQPPPKLFFFKFSLEWTDRPQWPTRNRRLFPPSLPAAAQYYLQQLQQLKSGKIECDGPISEVATETRAEAEETKDEETKNTEYREKFNTTDEQALLSQPSLPTPNFLQPPSPYPVPKAAAYDKVVASKYVGRALAEWAIVVTECDSFFARRRDEGIPCDRLVETPTLGVEFFRK